MARTKQRRTYRPKTALSQVDCDCGFDNLNRCSLACGTSVWSLGAFAKTRFTLSGVHTIEWYFYRVTQICSAVFKIHCLLTHQIKQLCCELSFRWRVRHPGCKCSLLLPSGTRWREIFFCFFCVVPYTRYRAVFDISKTEIRCVVVDASRNRRHSNHRPISQQTFPNRISKNKLHLSNICLKIKFTCISSSFPKFPRKTGTVMIWAWPAVDTVNLSACPVLDLRKTDITWAGTVLLKHCSSFTCDRADRIRRLYGDRCVRWNLQTWIAVTFDTLITIL